MGTAWGNARSVGIAGRGRESVLALVLLVVGTACGGGSSSPSPDAAAVDAAVPDAESGDAGATVIPPTTKVLDEATLTALSLVSDDRVELSFSAVTEQLRALEPDDILVAAPTEAAPDGVLRRVTSVSLEGSSAVVRTSFASLEDAIEQGELSFEQPFTLDDLDVEETLHEGIEPLKPDGAGGNAVYAAGDGKVGVSINDTIVPGVRVTGAVELSVTPAFSASWSGASLGKLTAKLTASESAALRVVGSRELSETKEKRVYRLKFRPKVAFVGYVPVVLRPVLDIYVGAEASASATFTTGADQILQLSGGLQYLKGAGWSTINEVTKTLSYESPSLQGDLSARVYARARMTIQLYGLAGPYIGASGHLRAEAKALQPDPWCELFVGVAGVAGITGKVAGVSLGEVERTLFEFEESLFQCLRPFLVVDGAGDLWASGVEAGSAFAPSSISYALSAKDGSTGSLEWTASADVDWIDLSATAGTATASETEPVVVTVNSAAAALPVGKHTGTVAFTNTTNDQGNTTRRVHLNVREQSMTVAPGPDSLVLGPRPEGDDFSGETYAFTVASDAGTIDYTISSSAAWITASPASGSVTEGNPVTVTVTAQPEEAAALPARAHQATVSFENVTTGKGSTTRTIYLQSAMRAASPQQLDATVLGDAGLSGITTASYTITAVNDDLRWTAVANTSWIQLSDTSGTVPAGQSATVIGTIDETAAEQLPTGTYEPFVVFTNEDSGVLSDQARFSTRLIVASNAFDPTLDKDGMALGEIDVLGRGYAVALTPSDEILIAGDRGYGPATWKMTKGGALDSSYGSGGVTTSSGIERVGLVIVGSSAITVGTTDNGSTDDILLWKQLETGALAESFGTAGVATIDSGFRDEGAAIAATSAGLLYIAGSSGGDLLLARSGASGALDETFGASGFVTHGGDGSDRAADVALDALERPIVVGELWTGDGADLVVLHYAADGTPVATFGAGGVVTSGLPGDDAGEAVAIDNSGRIVVAGWTVASGSLYRQLAVWRFASDGTPDMAFGAAGVAHYSGAQYSEASAVAIDAQGRIVVSGMVQEPSSPQRMTIWRFSASGSLDAEFGVGGLASWPSSELTIGRDLAIDSIGRLVIAGWHGARLAVWRFVP